MIGNFVWRCLTNTVIDGEHKAFLSWVIIFPSFGGVGVGWRH